MPKVYTLKSNLRLLTSCGAKVRTKPVPVLRIAASRGFSELTKNVIRSSYGHSTPSLKISCKSVQAFSRNLANKETKKERKKQTNKRIERKQYPVPRSIGDGVINGRVFLRILRMFNDSLTEHMHRMVHSVPQLLINIFSYFLVISN